MLAQGVEKGGTAFRSISEGGVFCALQIEHLLPFASFALFMSTDRIIIVGGGVIGLSIGWLLARAGREVTLFDRDRAGRAASWASAGMLSPLAETRFQEETLLRFGLDAVDRFPGFVRDLERETGAGVGYRCDGILVVGITPDDVGHLRFRYAYQEDLNLPVTWLSGDAAREREPHLSSSITAAVWCPGDHQVDNRRFLEALVLALQSAGGTLREQTPVEALKLDGHRVEGVLAQGEFHAADVVVLAAGCWSATIPGIPDSLKPPVRPVRGQILRLRMNDGFTLKTIIWYARLASSTLAYLVPRDDGQLLLGATSEEMGYDSQTTAGGVFELLRAGWEAVPGIYDLPIAEVQAGLRPGSRDDAPILGETPVDGLIMATGHYRKGFLLAPITAQAIADLILTGKSPDLIKPFGLDRFLS